MKRFLIIVSILMCNVFTYARGQQELPTNGSASVAKDSIAFLFRSGSNLLSDGYANNREEIAILKNLITQYEDVILTGNGHIRLVAPIGKEGAENPATINLAALRAISIRDFLKEHFRMLTDWNFTFYVDNTQPLNNKIEIYYLPHKIPMEVSSAIYSTDKKSNETAIRQALSQYKKLPYLKEAPVFEDKAINRARFDKINALTTNPVDIETKEGMLNSNKILVAIHYRWDKDKLDTLYLSNPENLHRLDSILTSTDSKFIDSLTIVAYASPEGPDTYNKRLSEKRARTIKDYITDRYEVISADRIITEARGNNWDGLRNLAMKDLNLPSRSEVLKILDSDVSSRQKQLLLTQLDGGVTYYRYILPNYYRYLRSGASILITYSPALLLGATTSAMPVRRGPVLKLDPIAFPAPAAKPKTRYPVAFKTNLLMDAVGAPNLSVEFPIGGHFSVVGDFAYAYWRSSKNLYALQTLQGGAELRYWFGSSDRKKLKNAEWEKPLKGWNIGLYGTYCSRYDVQWIDGYQGDGFWSAGLSGGYATPIARNLALEFTLGLGYFYTPEYRHYHEPEYNAEGKYHLMWQQTGSFGSFTLTKARISLVWLIRSEKKGGQK